MPKIPHLEGVRQENQKFWVILVYKEFQASLNYLVRFYPPKKERGD